MKGFGIIGSIKKCVMSKSEFLAKKLLLEHYIFDISGDSVP